jgi:4-hydroxybenzoate polyprenyltransferase
MNAFARLVRLPALPTALADVCLGALAMGALPEKWLGFLVLLLGSSCLYLSGMALNDWFDQEDDRRSRPDRPIPSGEVSSRNALLIGLGLMAAGVALASLAAGPVLAVLLAGAILLYDSGAKLTPAGPLAMGACRYLHVLLACSLAGDPWRQPGPHLALTVGLYITGVTWFARSEEKQSSRGQLGMAALVLLASLALALAAPVYRPDGTASPLFPYVLVALGFWVGAPAWAAMNDPRPPLVQGAVARLLRGLIVLDAALALGTAGTVGLVILVLLAPSLALARARRLYAT